MRTRGNETTYVEPLVSAVEHIHGRPCRKYITYVVSFLSFNNVSSQLLSSPSLHWLWGFGPQSTLVDQQSRGNFQGRGIRRTRCVELKWKN